MMAITRLWVFFIVANGCFGSFFRYPRFPYYAKASKPYLNIIGIFGFTRYFFSKNPMEPHLKSYYSKDPQEIQNNYKKIPLHVFHQKFITNKRLRSMQINKKDEPMADVLMVENQKLNKKVFDHLAQQKIANPTKIPCPFNEKIVTTKYTDDNHQTMVNYYNFLWELSPKGHQLMVDQWNLYEEFRCLNHLTNEQQAEKKQAIYYTLMAMENKHLVPALQLSCGMETLIAFNGNNILYNKEYNNNNVRGNLINFQSYFENLIDLLKNPWPMGFDAIVKRIKNSYGLGGDMTIDVGENSYGNAVEAYVHIHNKIKKHLFFKQIDWCLIKEYKASKLNKVIDDSVFLNLIGEMFWLFALEPKDLKGFLMGNIVKKVHENIFIKPEADQEKDYTHLNCLLINLIGPHNKHIYTFFCDFLKNYNMGLIENDFINSNLLLTQENTFIANGKKRELELKKKFNGYLKNLSINFNNTQWENIRKIPEFLPIYNILKKHSQGKFSPLKHSVLLKNFKTLLEYSSRPGNQINHKFIESYCNFLMEIHGQNVNNKQATYDTVVINDDFINKFLAETYPNFMNNIVTSK